jgi:hypothetical protein
MSIFIFISEIISFAFFDIFLIVSSYSILNILILDSIVAISLAFYFLLILLTALKCKNSERCFKNIKVNIIFLLPVFQRLVIIEENIHKMFRFRYK